MRTYRRLFQIFFLALILGSASGLCHVPAGRSRLQQSPAGPEHRTHGLQPGRQAIPHGRGLSLPRFRLLGPHLVGLPPERPQGPACDRGSGLGPDMPCPRARPGPATSWSSGPAAAPAACIPASMPATIPSSTAPAAARPYAGRTCSPTGATGSSRYAASSSDPFAGKNEKSAGDRAFFVLFSRHPARQAALSRIPAFFLCGRRGWHLAIRSFLT